MNKKLFGFGAALGVAVALAPSAHAAPTPVSDGATPASGDTLVTMTVPKFAEVADIPAALNFTVTPAEYGANATGSKSFGFKVRTNSTAGLTVSVASGTGDINDSDIALTSDSGGPITLTNSAQAIWSNSTSINDLPAANNVNLGLVVNNVNTYTVTGIGATATQNYTKQLLFTALPN